MTNVPRPRDWVDLVLLAALWGASFLFMRVAAPVFGPAALIEVRVGVAAACLLPLLAWRGGLPALQAKAAPIAVVGVLNSALPFVLFAYSTLALTAGFASIMNASVPLFTALIAWLLRDRIRLSQWIGLAIGIAGVAVLVWDKISIKPGTSQWTVTLAIAATLLASLSYGVAANFTRRRLAGVDTLAVATGSQIVAAVAVLPFAWWSWPVNGIDTTSWITAIALGVACTALAYILYFRLIANIGALRAASVTFLIPLFAVLWGGLFLGESITRDMIVGGTIILIGTALALGLIAAPRAATAAGR